MHWAIWRSFSPTETQVRVGRNSTLTVNEIAQSDSGTTDLTLQAGTIWARAARGGSGVDVKTPAAVAAIRGTDWSLTVDGSGKTGLVVLEGVVELKNAQGSVTVRQGEGAVASIGKAPTKFMLVNSNDREQMLFYLTLRDAFNGMPASPTLGTGACAPNARAIENIPANARSTDDWLSLAETALDLDGRAVALRALAEARSRPLNNAQRARADLVAGLIAGSHRKLVGGGRSLRERREGARCEKARHRRLWPLRRRVVSRSTARPAGAAEFGRDQPEAALAHAYPARLQTRPQGRVRGCQSGRKAISTQRSRCGLFRPDVAGAERAGGHARGGRQGTRASIRIRPGRAPRERHGARRYRRRDEPRPR